MILPSKLIASTILSLLALSSLYPILQSFAQVPPLVPPVSTGNNGAGSQVGTGVPTDRTPPKIEILNKDLVEGNNVINVKITDDSPLRTALIKYVANGEIIFANLLLDRPTMYKGLIEVKGPSAVLEFEIIDANGNRSDVAKEFQVRKQPSNIFEAFFDWLSRIFSTSMTTFLQPA